MPFRCELSCSFLYGDKVIILFFTQYFILNFSSYTTVLLQDVPISEFVTFNHIFFLIQLILALNDNSNDKYYLLLHGGCLLLENTEEFPGSLLPLHSFICSKLVLVQVIATVKSPDPQQRLCSIYPNDIPNSSRFNLHN